MYNPADSRLLRSQQHSSSNDSGPDTARNKRTLNPMRNDFINSSSKPYPTDDDDFLFQSPSYNGPQQPYLTLNSSSTIAGPYGQPRSHYNDYEMDTLPDNDSPRGLGPKAPLIASYTNETLSTFPHSHPYHYQESPAGNPFADEIDSRPLPRVPYDDGFASKPQPPLPDLELSEKDRIRRNEKARLRQLRSRPRFHYSRLPYFTMVVTLIQVIVFIVELAKMAHLTGSAFQTKPYFNPMLGPSTYLLINMGARYVPCMQALEGITTDTTIQFPCPNSTSIDTDTCSLSQLCGLSGVPIVHNKYDPHQWYRIITPIFLHAGFLHIIFNLLLQVTMGATIERHIGIIKYATIYLLSGIGGFLLGANFSPNGIASTGCSGSLFGIVATNIIMFVYCGRKNTNIYGTKHYVLFIFIMLAEIIISFVLGLLPGLDNFSHLGGFAMGLLTAILLLKDPFFVYQDGIITYSGDDSIWQEFVNNWNPFYNWESKIASRVYMWFGVRVVCLALMVLFIALLVNNFFGKLELTNDKDCTWCKYFNCIPVNGWCDMGEISVLTASTNSHSPTSTDKNNNTPLPTDITSPGNNRKRRYLQEGATVFENKPSLDLPDQLHIGGMKEDHLNSSISSLAVGAIAVIVALHHFKRSYSKQK